MTTVYAYDNANNRTSQVITGGTGAGTTNYSYNNLNQLTGYSNGTRSVALTYDLDGNRSTRVATGGSDNGTDTYSYDFENRLIGLVKGTAGGTGKLLAKRQRRLAWFTQHGAVPDGWTPPDPQDPRRTANKPVAAYLARRGLTLDEFDARYAYVPCWRVRKWPNWHMIHRVSAWK